jgi:hypothetical protein
VLKAISDPTAPFVAELFNRSFATGHFPTEFKHAFIIPIIERASRRHRKRRFVSAHFSHVYFIKDAGARGCSSATELFETHIHLLYLLAFDVTTRQKRPFWPLSIADSSLHSFLKTAPRNPTPVTTAFFRNVRSDRSTSRILSNAGCLNCILRGRSQRSAVTLPHHCQLRWIVAFHSILFWAHFQSRCNHSSCLLALVGRNGQAPTTPRRRRTSRCMGELLTLHLERAATDCI